MNYSPHEQRCPYEYAPLAHPRAAPAEQEWRQDATCQPEQAGQDGAQVRVGDGVLEIFVFVVREESRHREKKGGSQVTARA